MILQEFKEIVTRFDDCPDINHAMRLVSDAGSFYKASLVYDTKDVLKSASGILVKLYILNRDSPRHHFSNNIMTIDELEQSLSWMFESSQEPREAILLQLPIYIGELSDGFLKHYYLKDSEAFYLASTKLLYAIHRICFLNSPSITFKDIIAVITHQGII